MTLPARMTLKERLEQRASGWRDFVREAYVSLARHLEGARACDDVLQPGRAIPDFLLPNAEGRLVDSRELLTRGPLVLCFFRGVWCPFCSITLAALEEVLPRIEAAGATLVGVTPETGGLALEARRRLDLHYDVLCDVDNAVGLQFGVVFRAPDGYRRMLEKFSIDLGVRQGNAAWLLPMPALFVADRAGVLRHVHVSGDILDRAEPETIVRVLQGL